MYDISNPQTSGRVIAVWSPVSRQGAVSTTAAMLAGYMGKTVEDGKILILSTDANGGATAPYYMTKERMVNGLAEVIELSISDNLHSTEDIFNNTYSLTPNLDILSCSKMNTNVTDFLSRELINILKVARKGYKYIVIDTVCGQYDAASMAALKLCDALIVCMPQDKYIFESWIRKLPGVYLELVEKKPTTIVSAMHYEYPDMTHKDMDRELKGYDLYYISLNDLVHKAVSDRNVPEMIVKHMNGKHSDDAVLEIGAIFDHVVELIDNVVEKEMIEEQKKIDQSKQETEEYLRSEELFDDDMGYKDDSSESTESQDESSNSAVEDAEEPAGKEEQSDSDDDLYGTADSGSNS